ncbi:hypothetical protein TWF281_006327 [Arthrobotrys megalospora]
MGHPKTLALWTWLPLLVPSVVAPGPWQTRAPGCGEQFATITRRDFDNFYKSEKANIRAFAEAIEDIDYLQEEGKCPSNSEYLTVQNRDPSYHIQPLIDKLLVARYQLGETVEEAVVAEAEGMEVFYDEPDMTLLHTTIRNLEIVANSEKDAVDGFVAEIESLPRLRYPDINNPDKNLLNLAMQIDDGYPDGPFLVEYIVGARRNLQTRFDDLVEKLELVVSDFDNELMVHAEREHDDELDEWLPKGNSYQDITGALIRWTLCWAEGVGKAAEALRAIGPAPEPDSSGGGWRGTLGRGYNRLERTVSSIVWSHGTGNGRGKSRSPIPRGRPSVSRENPNQGKC